MFLRVLLFTGMPAHHNIGFKSNKRMKHIHPDGKLHFLVHNVDELNVLLMQNRTYAAEIGHAVGARKREEIVRT